MDYFQFTYIVHGIYNPNLDKTALVYFGNKNDYLFKTQTKINNEYAYKNYLYII